MRLLSTASFQRDCTGLPPTAHRALGKALAFLSSNLRHPSLRAQKLSGTGIWYARLNRGYRFTSQFESDGIVLRRVGTHDILAVERRRK